MEKAGTRPSGREKPGEALFREKIHQVLESLKDPETGLNYLRMGLVRRTEIEDGSDGKRANLVFRPTSPVCPMAFKLAWDLKNAVEAVDGIETVTIKVEGYARAAELETLLSEKEAL